MKKAGERYKFELKNLADVPNSDQIILRMNSGRSVKIIRTYRDDTYMVVSDTGDKFIAYDYELKDDTAPSIECLIKQVEDLNNDVPCGVIRDADTIIVDLIRECDDEVSGFAQDIFNIWRNSSDKNSVEQMFYQFTDVGFKEYLEKCLREISR